MNQDNLDIYICTYEEQYYGEEYTTYISSSCPHVYILPDHGIELRNIYMNYKLEVFREFSMDKLVGYECGLAYTLYPLIVVVRKSVTGPHLNSYKPNSYWWCFIKSATIDEVEFLRTQRTLTTLKL